MFILHLIEYRKKNARLSAIAPSLYKQITDQVPIPFFRSNCCEAIRKCIRLGRVTTRQIRTGCKSDYSIIT